MKKIHVDNLYEHADGGLYCLLSDDSALKTPDDGGDWCAAVIYIGVDQKLRATVKRRWEERFRQIPCYEGEDEDVMSMIRRANPGDSDLDFIRVMESWHESEINITGHMLELAVAAVIEKYEWPRSFADAPSRFGPPGEKPENVEMTITTEDLQRVLQTYEIERVPEPHGFTFKMRKSFPQVS